jgi:DNA ligase-1
VRQFAALYDEIDRTTSTNAKVAAMVRYFASAPPADAAWAVFFLTGRRLKRLVPRAAIWQWTQAVTGLDDWLLEECYSVVGDGAEVAALILDQLPRQPEDHGDVPLADWLDQRILRLREMDPATQQAQVTEWWSTLDRLQRFILLKLLTGELRVGVSQTLVVRALAQAADIPATTTAARIMGDWTPTAEWFESIQSRERTDDDRSRPYPFYLASPLEGDPATLGDPADWLIEWKWDGIRAQLVRRGGAVHLWSRGEELITHRFPEIAAAATRLPDGTVLDGEVLAFRDDRPLPFSALQQRIGRQKQVAQMARAVPVVFMAYDILEEDGADVRGLALAERRQRLEALLASPGTLRTSAVVCAASWEELARLRSESRARGVEGLMLKRLTSAYGVGRKKGDWWKWKIDPFTIDAVLIYAQPGSGRRASLLTDYTFGVWDAGELVPIAKAYSGLSNEEIAQLDRWIRRHTRERFGPVRHVDPVHVFELGFEAIARSSRHRSGVAVRFPRMLRWRTDKLAAEADTLEAVRRLLDAPSTPAGRSGQAGESIAPHNTEVQPTMEKTTGRAGTMDWTAEDDYWRTNYQNRSYIGSNRDYTYWQPAYRYGYESAQLYQGKSWNDVESDLATGWDRYEHRGTMSATWENIKAAVRDGWDRITGNR